MSAPAAAIAATTATDHSTEPTIAAGLLPHHARMLFAESGIAPEVARRRGCRAVTAAEARALGFADYQCGDGLLLPEWTTASVQRGFKLRRDAPRRDDRGKEIKYESPANQPTHFDVHPDAAPLLRDPAVPLYFTEGIRKSDAAWSRGHACVSISGVFAFLRGRLVVPDLDDIALEGRRARVVFDSDVTRKPGVAEALLRFCAALHRRGAQVEVAYLPEGPNGEKTGLDDFYARGGTDAELDALCRPWTGDGPGVWLRGVDEDTVAELRRERDAARADVGALTRAILNPDVSRSELVAVTSAAAQVLAKQERGEVEPDGSVVLTAAEIAHDWRPVPAKGERVAPTNPLGGRPRMARERVKPLLTPAVERGLITARPQAVPRQHANGSTFIDTVWRFDPIPSIAAALAPWANYHPAEPTTRKPRTATPPCPPCPEVHPILRRDACTGCGAVLAEKTIDPVASDNLSEAKTPAMMVPPPAAPRPIVRSFIGGDAPPLDEPAWLADAPDADAPDDNQINSDSGPAGVRDLLAGLEEADDPDGFREANALLGEHLAQIARARGRSPVPKPRRAPPPPHQQEAGYDRWTQ